MDKITTASNGADGKVVAFTIQAQQKNIAISPPQLIKSSKANEQVLQAKWNRFRVIYNMGELPVKLEHQSAGKAPKTILWLEDPNLMSNERFMDLFVKFSLGLPLIQFPYSMIAEQGVFDLLKSCKNSELLISCFPCIVRALHAALSSPKIPKKKMVLQLLCNLTQIPHCGPALVPYYKHLISPLRICKYNKAHDIEYEYGKSFEECVGMVLNTLEKTGFPKAFPAIKSIIPTYESCMKLQKP